MWRHAISARAHPAKAIWLLPDLQDARRAQTFAEKAERLADFKVLQLEEKLEQRMRSCQSTERMVDYLLGVLDVTTDN